MNISHESNLHVLYQADNSFPEVPPLLRCILRILTILSAESIHLICWIAFNQVNTDGATIDSTGRLSADVIAHFLHEDRGSLFILYSVPSGSFVNYTITSRSLINLIETEKTNRSCSSTLKCWEESHSEGWRGAASGLHRDDSGGWTAHATRASSATGRSLTN